jgi:hypothetical protein
MTKRCKNYMQKVGSAIKNADVSYKASYEDFHFDGDSYKKTYLGALLSLIVFGYVAYIGIVKA